MFNIENDVLYMDEDFIIVNKTGFQPTVPDLSGDLSLLEELQNSGKLKGEGNTANSERTGPIHRIDRPVRGAVLFARTKRGLTAANFLLQKRMIGKIYLAVLEKRPPENEGRLTDYLKAMRKGNKSAVVRKGSGGAKEAVLDYNVLGSTERYTMVSINLVTGRHHQIRAQFGHIGCPVKGDVKYGAKRTNREGGIMLFSRRFEFVHPFTGEDISVSAPLPDEILWNCFPDNC